LCSLHWIKDVYAVRVVAVMPAAIAMQHAGSGGCASWVDEAHIAANVTAVDAQRDAGVSTANT